MSKKVKTLSYYIVILLFIILITMRIYLFIKLPQKHNLTENNIETAYNLNYIGFS